MWHILQLGAQQWANQWLLRGNPLLGGNVVGNQLAQMQNLLQQFYQGHYGQQAPYLQSHHVPHPDRSVFPDSGLNDRCSQRLILTLHHRPGNCCVQASHIGYDCLSFLTLKA